MKKKAWIPYVLLTLTVLFWSGNFVLGRGIRQQIPAVSLNFWRWVGAFLILLPVGLPAMRRQQALIRHHWKLLVLMSIPSIVIFNTFIYTALKTVTTTNTVLLNALIPIFIAITLWVGYGERLQPRQGLGVAISLCGLVFIITRGDLNVLKTLAFSSGDVWTLGAGISWAIYSVMLRRRPVEMEPLVFLTAMVGIGIVLLIPFYLWELTLKGGFSLSLSNLAAIVYVCLFPSVLSYIFWNRGVDMVGANRAGIFFHLMPVFSIVMAFLFLGERLYRFHLIGIILIFTGIVLTTVSVKPK
jgi:drug/metabolite transporter (DMT)-like permease